MEEADARAPRLDFSRAEYAARLAATRAAMEAQGVELLVVSDPSNMAWLTGYDGWSFYVHQAVLVSETGDPAWFGREQDAVGARRTTYLGEADIVPYADHYVQSTERHPMEALAAEIKRRGGAARRIGVEMDNYYFSAAAFAALQSGLPNARFSDATGLVNWRRAVKSAQELEYMRIAGARVTKMHARIAEVARPGVRKCDLAAEIYAAGLRFDEAAGHGGDYPAIAPLLPSGADAAAPHLTWDDAPLKAGEGTFFEIAGVHKRYHCPLSRTIHLGPPPQRFLDAETAVLEGMEAGLEQARAGRRCEDIAAAFFGVLARWGVEKSNRAGYAIGLSYPPDWGERTMSIRAGDQTELRPGMTFHFMTGLWREGAEPEDWGFEITESLVITEGAPELLASAPRRLLVVE
ncbi:MAG: ectoine hydrolase DoeA [Pseudomonadota bacterium]